MNNYSPLFINDSVNSAITSNDDGFFVPYKSSYKAYITPKITNYYELSDNIYASSSMRIIDQENRGNYSTHFTKTTDVPSASDLLYKRYYNDTAQTSNLWQKFSDKLTHLRDIVGNELFEALKFDQQLLMASTMGVINIDYIDPKSISKITKG